MGVLCGPGGSVRAVLAPAGFGKTAMVHVAATALRHDGRPVRAVATTAKAVAELDAAGLAATTIARLRIDLTSAPLRPGTVIVLDEISQTSTHDAHTVLSAVAATDGGMVVVLLEEQLAHHWAEVIVGCARAGDPLAFGTERLRHARRTLTTELWTIETQLPVDRQRDLQPARPAPRRSGPARPTGPGEHGQRRASGRQRRRATPGTRAEPIASRQVADARGELDRAQAAQHDAEERLNSTRDRQRQRPAAPAETVV